MQEERIDLSKENEGEKKPLPVSNDPKTKSNKHGKTLKAQLIMFHNITVYLIK